MFKDVDRIYNMKCIIVFGLIIFINIKKNVKLLIFSINLI